MFAFSLRKFFWGLLVVAIGLLLWAHNYGLIALSFNFSRDWPIIIVIIGLLSVWNAIFGRHWWSKNCCAAAPKDHIPARARKILEDVENGNISAEEAIKKMNDK